MTVTTERRGFQDVLHPVYAPKDGESKSNRLVGQSSAVGDYEDSWDKPGSSFLWFGNDLHLNREQVTQLVALLQNWLATGKLV